jgi:hypothetical protein
MKLVIEHVAPLGPAHSITFEGRTYPVLGCRIEDDGMTEIYELAEAT